MTRPTATTCSTSSPPPASSVRRGRDHRLEQHLEPDRIGQGRRLPVDALHRATGPSCLSKSYNYVAFGMAVSPRSGKRYWAGGLIKGPDLHWRLDQAVHTCRSRPELHADQGHLPLDRLRHRAPGPDVGAAALRGPAPGGRRGLGELRNHHRHVHVDILGAGPRLSSSGCAPWIGPATGVAGRPSPSGSEPALGPSRALTCDPAPDDARRVARRCVSRRRIAPGRLSASTNASMNPCGRSGSKPVLPPEVGHPQDAGATVGAWLDAADEVVDRTAAAGRSSPSVASGPGRRPPRCSRSRRATATVADPTRTGRAEPGTPHRAR